VAFFDAPYPTDPNYVIVDTDYTSFSVVYACTKFRQYLWYLSRAETVTQEWRDQMHAIAAAALPNFNFSMMANPATDDI
jgi:lipocalin